MVWHDYCGMQNQFPPVIVAAMTEERSLADSGSSDAQRTECHENKAASNF